MPRPTAIFHSTPTVGLPLDVSICESAARLTPEATASSSSERLRALRRRRRLSPTRRAISAAPSSSPGGKGCERAGEGRSAFFLGGMGDDGITHRRRGGLSQGRPRRPPVQTMVVIFWCRMQPSPRLASALLLPLVALLAVAPARAEAPAVSSGRVESSVVKVF